MIEGLKKQLPEDVYSVVSGFHADVVGLLKSGGPGNCKADEVEQRLKEARPRFRAAALEQGKFEEPLEEARNE